MSTTVARTKCGGAEGGAGDPQERLRSLRQILKGNVEGSGNGDEHDGSKTRKRRKSRKGKKSYKTVTSTRKDKPRQDSSSESDPFDSSGSSDIASSDDSSSSGEDLVYKAVKGKRRGKDKKHKHHHHAKSKLSFGDLPFFLGGDPILDPLGSALSPFGGIFDVMPGKFPSGMKSILDGLPTGLFGDSSQTYVLGMDDLFKNAGGREEVAVDQGHPLYKQIADRIAKNDPIGNINHNLTTNAWGLGSTGAGYVDGGDGDSGDSGGEIETM